MLLSIIDQWDGKHSRSAIQISLKTVDQCVAFMVDDFSSPLTDNFRDTLDWYYAKYPQTLTQPADDKGTVEKLVRCGQFLADRLLGEDLKLMQIKDVIEDGAYTDLSVQLESSRMEFFQEPWEALILPDAKYVLSTVTRNFVRRFTGLGQPGYEAEVRYELGAGTEAQTADASPLGILHIIARSADDERPVNGYNASTRAMRWGTAMHYELWPHADFKALQRRLANPDQPVHSVHYDGPIQFREGKPYLYLGGHDGHPQSLSLASFCRLLAQQKLALLSFDACAYRADNGDGMRADLGLASVAQTAAAAGLTNVTGLSYLTDPWTADQCFDMLYEQLLSGLALGQAVVEARKRLQTQIETRYFRVDIAPFHSWPLLTHYGGKSVYFFNGPQPALELTQSPTYRHTRQQLFGFCAEYLPPEVNHIEDQSLCALLVAAQTSTIHRLSGTPGSGKTHLVHQAAFYWVQQQQVKYAFYFDLASSFYSRTDVLQMIAPIFDCIVDETDKLQAALRATRCHFVFDNLDLLTLSQWSQATEAAITELGNYLVELVQQGHIVVVTGRDECPLTDVQPILVQPLSLPAQQALATAALGSDVPDTVAADLLPLLQHLWGNPFLIQRIIPQLTTRRGSELIRPIEHWLDTATDKVQQYYAWQWSELLPPWQKLLCLFSDLPDIPLEMVKLVCEPTNATESRTFEPAVTLFAQLNVSLSDEKLGFKQAMDSWQHAGFLLQRAYGKTIDPRCRTFLTQQQAAESAAETDVDALLISQILCEGIRRVAQHLQQQPNPLMSHYLLGNRYHWVKHFEALWFAQEYVAFLRVKAAFDHLLREAGLEHESAAWSLDLLTRVPAVTAASEHNEATAAWLRLAHSALDAPEAEHHELFSQTAPGWQDWLSHLATDEETNLCIESALEWLHALYQKRKEWSACRQISEIAHRHHQQHKIWPRIIQDLKRLVQCNTALQALEQARSYENALLEDLPFDTLPAGLKTQLMLEVACAQVARGDTESAQIRLDQLRQSSEAAALQPAFDTLQADIDYQEARYEDAMRGYCQLWKSNTVTDQRTLNQQHIQNRLTCLKQALGADRFNNLCQQELGEVIQPDA